MIYQNVADSSRCLITLLNPKLKHFDTSYVLFQNIDLNFLSYEN